MTEYERGFADRCASLGVDPHALVKRAYVLPTKKTVYTHAFTPEERERLTVRAGRMPVSYPKAPGVGKPPAVTPVTAMPPKVTAGVPTPPALGKMPPPGKATAAPAKQTAVAAKNGRPQYTTAQVREMAASCKPDECYPMKFEPQNFWKNLGAAWRRAWK